MITICKMYLHINSAALSTTACCPLNEHVEDFIRENTLLRVLQFIEDSFFSSPLLEGLGDSLRVLQILI